MKHNQNNIKSFLKFSFSKMRILVLVGVVCWGVMGGVGKILLFSNMDDNNIANAAIVSWSNTKTGDNDIMFLVTQGETITFSVSPSGAYEWQLNKVVQSATGGSFAWTVPDEKSIWEIHVTDGLDHVEWIVSTLNIEEAPVFYDDFSDGRWDNRIGVDPWNRSLPDWYRLQNTWYASNGYFESSIADGWCTARTDLPQSYEPYGTWEWDYQFDNFTDNPPYKIEVKFSIDDNGYGYAWGRAADGHQYLFALTPYGTWHLLGWNAPTQSPSGSNDGHDVIGTNWHHVKIIRDRNGSIKVWEDGVLRKYQQGLDYEDEDNWPNYEIHDNPSLYTPNNGAPNWSFTNNSTRVEVSFFRPRDTSPLGQRNKIDNFVFYSEADGVTVSTPTFSPAQGTYSDAQTASISTATTDATIRYTINGTDPTESSTIYTNPITISNTITVKAIAYKSGFTPSDIATATYTITAPSDTTPPNISDGSPSGTIAYDAIQTNLTITTDENATCKYSTTQNTEYSSISNTFTTTSSANHSTQIINLTSGSSHTYYIRCIDTSDNTNTSDYTISFTVASAPENPGGGGGGGGTTPSDTTPPSKITDLTALAGDQEIILTWKNPTDSDFVKTKILRKEDDYSVNNEDGELVYDGNERTYTDTGLTNNTAYYYSAFTYDEVPNYSESATTSATPEEGKVPDPPSSDPNPEEETYPEGTLLQTPDSFKIYVIINQKKKWIPTPEVFETLGYEWGNITQINTATLNAIPNYEDNLIRAINDYKVYLVVNGIKRHIPNPEIFLNYGFAWEDVVDVPQTTIDKYTRAHLIRESRQEAIYYLRFDGVKKHIRNSEIFTSYNNSWDDVQVISKMEIDSYPESNLIQLQGDNRIYLIENNAKRHISSTNVFNKNGYNWEHVVIVNRMEFEWYEIGGELR